MNPITQFKQRKQQQLDQNPQIASVEKEKLSLRKNQEKVNQRNARAVSVKDPIYDEVRTESPVSQLLERQVAARREHKASTTTPLSAAELDTLQRNLSTQAYSRPKWAELREMMDTPIPVIDEDALHQVRQSFLYKEVYKKYKEDLQFAIAVKQPGRKLTTNLSSTYRDWLKHLQTLAGESPMDFLSIALKDYMQDKESVELCVRTLGITPLTYLSYSVDKDKRVVGPTEREQLRLMDYTEVKLTSEIPRFAFYVFVDVLLTEACFIL